MTHYLVGFAGVARCGKTTAAEICRDQMTIMSFGAGCIIEPQVWSYAAPIRMALEDIGVYKDKHPQLYREMAQYLGARMRKHDPHHWLKQMQNRIEENTNKGCITFIDDVRYPNEVLQIQDMGGTVIYIDPGERMAQEIATNALYMHESEDMAVNIYNHIPTIPHYIYHFMKNEASIEAYAETVQTMVSDVLTSVHGLTIIPTIDVGV